MVAILSCDIDILSTHHVNYCYNLRTDYCILLMLEN